MGSQWTSKPLSFFTSDHVAAVGDAVVGLMFCDLPKFTGFWNVGRTLSTHRYGAERSEIPRIQTSEGLKWSSILTIRSEMVFRKEIVFRKECVSTIKRSRMIMEEGLI